MKFIFLDFDGVLNNMSTKGSSRLEYHLVVLLNDLKGVEFVVSSTWRIGRSKEELTTILQSYGFKGTIYGVTDGAGLYRGEQIHRWLEEHRDLLGTQINRYRDYVILDDDSDMLYYQRNNFICVDNYTGITPKTIFKIKQMLDLKGA